MESYFNRIVELFAKSNVSASSLNEFHQWLTDEKHQEEKEKALHNLWKKTADGTIHETSAATWKSLIQVYKRTKQPKDNNRRRLLLFWQVSAACLLIALISTVYFINKTTPVAADLIEQYVPIAEMKQFTLPDGTVVQMNSTATLLYLQQFT